MLEGVVIRNKISKYSAVWRLCLVWKLLWILLKNNKLLWPLLKNNVLNLFYNILVIVPIQR